MNPATPLRFYVVTNGKTFKILEALESDELWSLWLARPSFHLVQILPNRVEAEAYLQFVSSGSGKVSPPGATTITSLAA